MMTTITLLHKKSFQSTHSLRSATEHPRDLPVPGSVSIHALLAECDRTWAKAPCGQTCFNPRTPCGVRLHINGVFASLDGFQSTHSLRSATRELVLAAIIHFVSIHALLAECDCARPYTLLLNRANHTLRQPP